MAMLGEFAWIIIALVLIGLFVGVGRKLLAPYMDEQIAKLVDTLVWVFCLVVVVLLVLWVAVWLLGLLGVTPHPPRLG